MAVAVAMAMAMAMTMTMTMANSGPFLIVGDIFRALSLRHTVGHG